MQVAEAVIRIEAPPERVWAFISDLPRTHEWVTFTDRMTHIDPGPVGVGTMYREWGGVGPNKGESTWKIVEFDPPRRQVHVGDLGVMKPRLTMTVEGDGNGGSILTHRTEFRMEKIPRAIAAVLERVVVKRVMTRGLRESQENARRLLEARVDTPKT